MKEEEEEHTLLPNNQILYIRNKTRIITLYILAHQRDKDKEIQCSEALVVPPWPVFVREPCDAGDDGRVNSAVCESYHGVGFKEEKFVKNI